MLGPACGHCLISPNLYDDHELVPRFKVSIVLGVVSWGPNGQIKDGGTDEKNPHTEIITPEGRY